jgi:hypothetical protein
LSEYIESLGDQPVLAIDNVAGLQWLIHRQTSISVDVVALRPEAYFFHFKNRSFANYLVVQRMGADFDRGTRFPSMDDDLGDGFQLELIEERSFSPVYHIRISRVVGVDEEKVKAWAQRRTTAVHLTPEMKSALSRSDADAIDRWFKLLP